MRDKAFRWLAGHQAVIICLLWGIWDAATAVAYLDGAPQQLQTAERLLHMPIWVVWAAAATMLIIGALVPAGKGRIWMDAAIWLRGIGLAISAALLGVWSLEFFFAESERGWVSGKNYLLLTFVALHYGWMVSRYSVREG